MSIADKLKVLVVDLFQDNGKWSLDKLSSAAVVVCTLAWVTRIVAHTLTLPDLNGPAIFIGVGGGVHAGIGAWKQKLAANGNGNGDGH